MSSTADWPNVADRETQDEVYKWLTGGEQVWGFIEHMNILSPTERITPIAQNKYYKNVTSNLSTGAVSLNDWADHPVLKANKPYMVKLDGTPDYRLSESDYTKKADDAAASDVSNVNYSGGAFAWFPRIYKYERMEGDDRRVLFSMTPRDGYTPNGFIDPDGNTLEGVWLPMFYYNGQVTSCAGTDFEIFSVLWDASSTIPESMLSVPEGFGASKREVCLGGPIVETIIDFLMMISGTANIQSVFGYGNCLGGSIINNNVVGGGAFYGTKDGKSLNKILHSIVLGSYQLWQLDPYEILKNGEVYVAKNYDMGQNLDFDKHVDTGIYVPAAVFPTYPLTYRTVPGYGSVPAEEFAGGSSELGGCDEIWRSSTMGSKTIMTGRFGCYNNDQLCNGPRARAWNRGVSDVEYGAFYSKMLLPPVGVTA